LNGLPSCFSVTVDRNKMKYTLSFIGLVLILVLILISFPKELGVVPVQDISRWTQYPAWHPEIIGL